MPRRGLTPGAVVDAAVALIEERGRRGFTMRELAERLQVKTAALYNHVEGIDALYAQVGYAAIARLRRAQLEAVEGLERDGAVRALAWAYYTFAHEHARLYEVIMAIPMSSDEALVHAVGGIVEPVMAALERYFLTVEQKMHLQRVLRSILHGFISQEAAGCFRHFPVELEESVRIGIENFLVGVHALEGENREKREQ